MTLPNTITLSRILLSPLYMVFFLIENPYTRLTALIILVVSEMSDALDGHLARKYNLVTDVGKLLDPLADSIFRFTIFLSFLVTGHAEVWMIIIIFYRDALVSWIRTVAASQNLIVSARMSGKIKALVQAFVTFSITVMVTVNHWNTIPYLEWINFFLMLVVTIVTVYSALDYFIGNWQILKAAFADKGGKEEG